MNINDKYKLLELLGSGSYGNVYKGIEIKTDVNVAIKMNDDPFLLDREIKIYKYLWKYIHNKYCKKLQIPKLFWDGLYNTKKVIVLERLGDSLDKIFDNYKKKWSHSTIYWIAKNIIEILNELHELGIVHRDIKPDNFSIGFDNRYKLYIFDFGLSSQYINTSGKHVAERNGLSLIGTMRYASINNHNGIQQSRRDDLESLLYMLLYFWHGNLPWKNIEIKDRNERNKKILEKKMNTINDILPESFKPFYDYIKNLKYQERPNYKYWITYFDNLYEKNTIKQCLTKGIDWIYDYKQVSHINIGKTYRKKRI